MHFVVSNFINANEYYQMNNNNKDLKEGLLFTLALYFLGAIDFSNPISYIVIISCAINIGFPSYRILICFLRDVKK